MTSEFGKRKKMVRSVVNTHVNRITEVQKRFLCRLTSKSGMRYTLPLYEETLKHFKMNTLLSKSNINDYSILYKIANTKWAPANC